MKVLNEKSDDQIFTPFVLSLKIETLEEAKLLQLVFKFPYLKQALLSKVALCPESQDKYDNMQEDFYYNDRNEVYDFLQKKIEGK